MRNSDMENEYCYKYPMTAITADVIAYRYNPNEVSALPEILLVKRKNDPYKGKWALPGGFIDPEEKAVDAARRELLEETGLKARDLSFVSYLDDPKRDPRNRTVSFVFKALIGPDQEANAGDDAAETKWFKNADLYPEMLAFDHGDAINDVFWQLLV